MKTIFLVTVKTLNKKTEYDIEPNTEIIIPVLTNSNYNAIRKVESSHWGSEYPTYEILYSEKCSHYLFKPVLK